MWLDRLAPYAPYSAAIVGWATYHPAAALRSTAYRLKLEEDVQRFSLWIHGGEAFPGNCVRCNSDELDQFDEYGLAWCAKHSPRQMTLI